MLNLRERRRPGVYLAKNSSCLRLAADPFIIVVSGLLNVFKDLKRTNQFMGTEES
jgi:hypothetical protein